MAPAASVLCLLAGVTGALGIRIQDQTFNPFTDSEAVQNDLKEGLTILTDLDDTLICSGGSYLKGVDKVCAGTRPHETYPGAAAFYYALSLAKRPDVQWGDAENGKAIEVIPLSARPTWYKTMKPCEGPDLAIRQQICGCENAEDCTAKGDKCTCFGLDTDGALYGSTGNLTDHLWVGFRTYDKFGARKVLNWGKARKSFTTRASVFVGDNGQADRRAAVEMIQKSADFDDTEKGYMLVSFIHDVTSECAPGAPCRSEWADKRVFIFDNYKEAADIAEQHNLITKEHADKVREAYKQQFKQPEPEKKPCPFYNPACWR